MAYVYKKKPSEFWLKNEREKLVLLYDLLMSLAYSVPYFLI